MLRPSPQRCRMRRILAGLPSPTLTLPRDTVTLPEASPDSPGRRYRWSHQAHRLLTPAPWAPVRWVWAGAGHLDLCSTLVGPTGRQVWRMLTNSTFQSILTGRWFQSWGQPRVLGEGQVWWPRPVWGAPPQRERCPRGEMWPEVPQSRWGPGTHTSDALQACTR